MIKASKATTKAVQAGLALIGYNPYNTSDAWARCTATHANRVTLKREARNDREAHFLMIRQAG